MTYIVDDSGWKRVGDGKPVLRTRFKSRAIRRRDKLNAQRIIPSYRYEVVGDSRRWTVVAFQNYARSA